MLRNGQFHKARTKTCYPSMCDYGTRTSAYKKNKYRYPAQIVYFNLYCILIVMCISIQTANSNTTNMNRHFNGKSAKDSSNNHQSDTPHDDNYDDHDTHVNENEDYTKVNFDHNPYYNSESFVHLNNKFYNTENNAYSNYEDYKKYYLNPSNPKANVKFKISSRIVQTKYGKLQGIVLAMDEHRYLSPLEVFLGVPYATPPVGSNRFSPTRTPSPWDGVRVSDRPGPACPQKLPDLNDERTILEKMPKGRLEYMKRLMPYLKNQSEDCLYLNIFAPLQMDETKLALPVLVYIHGESYSWSSGNPYDGGVLSSYTDLIVVTLNFRLGVLGFLNANPAPHLKARVANYGLMDQIAALHWVQQNIALFGGDPTNITLMGHGSGAACINFLMISPTVMPGLFHRAILLSGSALSSWAIVDDPVYYSLKLAKQMNCSIPEDLTKDHEVIVDCLREVSIEELLSVDISPPNFLTAFGPSVDGVVIKTDFAKDFLTMYSTGDFPSFGPLNNMNANLNTHKKRSDSGRRLFQNKYDLLFGVVTSEALWKFSAHDIQNGIEPEKRDRMLRTYVRNSYTYHLSEIFYTIVNEYTDWERTNPINTRDATVAALSDAQYVAPLVQSGDLLSGGPKPVLNDEDGPRRPTKTFFYVFDYQTKDGFYPQRMGASHGEELPYVFGAPLVDGFSHFPQNYTKSEVALSESIMLFIANFARTGNPNDNARQEVLLPASRERNKFRGTTWEEYDSTHQKYLEIGMKPRLKNHYRAHQLSVWLRLVPELHRAGMEDVAARHNLFKNHNEQDLYEGIVRPDPLARSANDNDQIRRGNSSVYSDTALTTVDTILATCATIMPNGRDLQTLNNTDNALANLEAAGYAAYSTALSVTIAIGCSLLILNVLIFAGVYYQRDKSRSRSKQQRFNEKHFETISGKHSHYHIDPTHAPSLVVDVERQNRKKQMMSDPHLSGLNFKGPLDISKSPPSPSLSIDNMILPSKLGSRNSSFRLPNASYPQVGGYATMPKNLNQFNNSPPLQELRQQKFQPPNGSAAQGSPGREGDSSRGPPHATLRRGKAAHGPSLPQAAIDEMRV
ncbi:neuroligin-4, Y-linked-like isoform X2 [Galleria mellonella]|uniref:Neuroligin-4, Y-linked-like isoform X2 n=1 Tax=Galleria mellonella TaxID=7137 RepID=A0A6J3CB35_GALME|nr:neuroligin-4, Y-linked-like isoform X2 [Galleria mellonella]